MANDEQRLDPTVLRVAGILVFGALAPLLDSTIVNVALRALGRDLHTSLSTVQLVSTGYLLALVMAVPVTGWAVDRFGAKRMWLVALTLFLAGSLLCAAAWNIAALIGFRLLQGIGGGLMLPILQTIVLRTAGGRALGRLMSVITLPALAGPILGPVVGGLIVGHLSWRWIFLVNAPICLLALLLAGRGLPADPPPDRTVRLDRTGLALLSPALAGLVYGLSQIGNLGGVGHWPVLVPLLAGAVLLAAFVAHALRVPTPLVALRLFAVRSFAASAALLFAAGVALFGSMLLLPLYYQQGRGHGVVAAGLLLVPQGLGSLLARVAGGLTDRVGPRPVVLAGVALTAAGTLPFAVAGPSTGNLVLAVALVVRGLGLSALNLAVMVGAFHDLDREQIPHASTATRIMQQLGGSVGTAVFAVVLQRQLGSHGAAAAFDHTFWVAVVLIALAVLPALLLPRRAAGQPAKSVEAAGSRV